MLPAYHKAFRLVYDDFIHKNDEKPGGKKMEKVKKPIYKKWWFWVIIVVVVFAIEIGRAHV